MYNHPGGKNCSFTAILRDTTIQEASMTVCTTILEGYNHPGGKYDSFYNHPGGFTTIQEASMTFFTTILDGKNLYNRPFLLVTPMVNNAT